MRLNLGSSGPAGFRAQGLAPRQRGFTLIELLVAIVIVSVLLMLAAQGMGGWVRNAQVRTTAEALQTGLRLAQSEAVRRNRQVVFFRTNAEPGLAATAAGDGSRWVIRWIPLPGDTVTAAAPALEPFVQGGQLADYAAGVTLQGPTALCFNSMGRRVATAATGVVGATCTAAADELLARYDVARAGAERALRVTVALGGQVRMCDPARTLSDATPDGCPA